MAYNPELQMLRELVRFYVIGRSCFFCKLPLHYEKPQTFGHKGHTAFRSLITIHHIDGNHENNDRSNLADCHRDCHKSYHKHLRNAAKEATNAT